MMLMDRTDLKGYFINLAHPEVNMAHIQLTEVVALYPALYYCLDKAPRLSISIVIWILSSDTETSAATPLGGGARKVLAK